MPVFFAFIFFVIIQRIIELIMAKRNEKWMKAEGAKEFGQNHYYWMVLLHTMFFLTLMGEVVFFHRSTSDFFFLWLFLFVLLQIGRIWVIQSLGRYWNTKIIVLKDADTVRTGPYKWFRHPNYMIVTLELAVIPLMFQAYFTLFLFAILNQWILLNRISIEEKALTMHTKYQEVLDGRRNLLFLRKKHEENS
ncbi:methyltransferase [Oikeobacillus pervagus]|uniref:Methyltransferase n=1 Tax=Oikeobacillus pervagus TaxID=1325931 RepID=A0AAJ1T2F9_9BACI|nr:isoprenylcysteine carboxylmethyltransferase family protein [Oikeobacillus pervagus]MDQ0213635.1 methyltransferase [Oikeobacillus pervagus]